MFMSNRFLSGLEYTSTVLAQWGLKMFDLVSRRTAESSKFSNQERTTSALAASRRVDIVLLFLSGFRKCGSGSRVSDVCWGFGVLSFEFRMSGLKCHSVQWGQRALAACRLV